MKITDMLLDACINTTVFEQAFQRKVIKDKVRNLQDTIAEHLVKVYMFGDSIHMDHWIKELDIWFAQINRYRVKPSNQPLDRDTLFQILFDELLGHHGAVQDFMNDLYRRYSDETITEPDADRVNKKIYELLADISADLSAGRIKPVREYINVV